MNTRLLLLSILFSLSSYLGFSQGDDYYGNTLNSSVYAASDVIINPTVQPPDVAAFQKSTFVPVSNYTGRANISIPIYEISAGSMSVPISLSYNSSGVKVSDMASSVGLNWSLNAGGVVSRMVKGMDDFLVPDSNNNPAAYMTPSGWLGYMYPGLTVLGYKNRYNDAQPDLFSANAPGLSTNYVHTRHYNINSNGSVSLSSIDPAPLELEHQGNLINETLGLVTKNYYNETLGSYQDITRFGYTNIEITSINGIVYDFASPDLSFSTSPFSGANAYKFDSFRLDQMFDPATNQTITFEYEQYSNYFYDDFPTGSTRYGAGSDVGNLGDSSNTIYLVTQRLTKIVFDKGSVEFIYDLNNRLDNTGEKALTEIKVKDADGLTIKHVKLEHTYFQSSINSNAPQSKRLRLDRVYEVDPTNTSVELPGHEFTYDTTMEMPPRDTYAHDFLGYNNGSYNASITDPAPKYYFKNNAVTPFYDASAIELTGNYSLEANENFAKTYSLTKMNFPTGGTNEYEYEHNEFSYSGTKVGGGLRVKSQKITDAKGNEQILDYEYGTGSIGKMPLFALFKGGVNGTPTTLAQLTASLGIDTFMTPQSQVEFTNGSFVGYNSVAVKDRIANGKTIFSYTSPSSFPNIASTKTYDNTNSTSSDWVIFGAPALSIDRDYMRGKPTGEVVYDKNNNKRLWKHYYYTHKEFSTLSLEHLNKASKESECYSMDGEIYSDDSFSYCGSYYEKLELPIARYVLTQAITYDYPENPNEQPFVTAQNYTYDYKYPLVIQERHTNCEDGPTQGGDYPCQDLSSNTDYDHQMIKLTTYPLTSGDPAQQQSDVTSSLPYASNLVTQNRLSTPMNVTFKDRDNQVTGEEDHYFKSFGNNIIALEKINFISRDNNITNSETITKRDSKGHIIEYQKRNGVYVSRIYGRNKTYLVAEIENTTYSSIEALSAFGTNFTLASELSTAQETALRGLSDTMVTTYTYNPLIGIASITDPRGYSTSYEYDEFNRLKQVKDADGKILSENNYHYKGQQ